MQGDESSAGIASASAVGSSAVVSLPTDEMPPLGEKEPDARHGNRFQSKLLMLFCIRAINAEYKFYLGTELPDQGNKFDDLIFKFKKDGEWRYQYLQAKSRLKEKSEKITAKDLFAVPKKGRKIDLDFSLPKYFRSYCEITRRGDKIGSCIICTNIDFENKESLKEKGIEVKEVQLNDKILQFAKISDGKTPTRCKIEIKNKEKSDILKEETTSKILAKMLWETKDINLNPTSELIRNYHIALVNENVIDPKTKKFREDFINGPDGLTEGAKELRKNLLRFDKNFENLNKLTVSSDKTFGKTKLEPKEFNYDLPVAVKDEEIQGFLDKLIFAVNTPNEDELDDVLKSEVGKYFTLESTDLQSAFVMNEMVNWFKREHNIWLSSEDAKELFLNKTHKIMESIRVNAISIDYQDQLRKDVMGLEFNKNSIEFMTEKLKRLFKDTSSSVITIGSDSPQHTAVKFIAAIKTLPDFKCDDSFLVTPSKRLNDEVEAKKFKHCLELKEDSHNLLVVVCDGETSAQNYEKYASLIPDGRSDDKINKVVIICADKSAMITDEINYTDLTDEFKQKLLSQKVSFQLKKDLRQHEIEDNKMTVRKLIGDIPEEVIDINSIKELTQLGRELIIPSFDDTTHFDEQMYIKRKLKFPICDKFEDEIAKRLHCKVNQLQGECKIRPDGHIEWLVEDKRKKEIWDKILDVTNQSSSSGEIRQSSLNEIHEDDDEDYDRLIPLKEHGKEKSIVIISGVAGTGKSTLLSHFYKEIKTKKPDYWVIKMNLVDRSEAIMKWYDGKQTNTDDIFINYLSEMGNKDSFTISLLRHRLEKGDRIAIMLDGFDEIDAKCQRCAIQLMKAISKNKSIQLYVTTRPHSVDDLQNKLFQFSYTLENFDKDDQIKYLTEYWETKLDTEEDIQDKSIIRKFAASLTDRVSQTLRDQERSFIGIPLQCRILAECFQQELHTIIKRNSCKYGSVQTDFENQLFANVNFDLNSLYERLMKTKRRVFREEKVKAPVPNQITDYAIDSLIEKIESHLTKLAIETLVTDKKSSDILWPPQLSYHQLKTDKMKEENMITEFGVKFGLIMYKDEAIKTQFLHRTFAEYLLAKYLYRGIAVNHCENNYLLDNEPVRDLIISKILGEDNYDGVRMFIDSMLKETVNSTAWRVISEGKHILPSQLQNFSIDLALFMRHIWKPVAQDTYYTYCFTNILGNTVYERNENLFDFLCDCLEIVLDKNGVRQVFRFAFKNSFRFESFYFVNSGLFQRFTKYYDDPDYIELNCITQEMLFGRMSDPCTLELALESYHNIWNTKEAKQVVKILLDLIEQNRTVFMKEVIPPGTITSEKGDRMFKLLHFFTFNEYYDSIFDQFFRLLSSMCLDDCNFTKLLQYTLRMRDANNNNWAYLLNSGIGKTLIILRDLGRNKVIEGLSHLTLVCDKTFFETFYQPCQPKEEENPSDLQLLLKNRDSSRMTLLHRAAFYGDAQTVDDILETIYSNFSSGQHPDTNRLLVKSAVVDIMLASTNESFTPFYVAAACDHKEICLKILSFLKKILGADHKEDLTCYGFVYIAIWDAILFKNLQMFQVILEAVKEAWGRNSLLVLLSTDNYEVSYHNSLPLYVSSTLTKKFNKDLLKTKVKVLLQNDSEKGYEDLNDLVLTSNDREFKKTLEDLEDETLQGMLTAKGLENWMQCFFDKFGINLAFHLLSRNLLARFTRNQRSQFVDAITSPSLNIHSFYRKLEISYWAKWCVGDEYIHDFDDLDCDCLDKLLKIIAENQDNETTDIQKLLFSDDGKDITRALLCRNRKIVSIMFNHLSEMEKLQITKDIKRNVPEIIDEISHYLRTNDENKFRRELIFRYWVNILPFYDDGDEGNQQFENLVDTLLSLRTEKLRKGWYKGFEQFVEEGELQYSFWSRYLDSYDDRDDNKIEMVGQFLKCVSEKLGNEAVKKVVLHEDCMGIVLLGAELQENKQLANVMLTHLSDHDRDCVVLLISTNCPFNSRRRYYLKSVSDFDMPYQISSQISTGWKFEAKKFNEVVALSQLQTIYENVRTRVNRSSVS
ncbi:uncharacterized protein LOC124204693 [Daphnia pulex]|uniref:uncharacterized protein LOC124204693 n=1 Tax=Daphnia pulex TaxID=6669 RepID=UPI001EDF8E90|nr:uncharacterized protein LOC124204693 [Daphnia pulex]